MRKLISSIILMTLLPISGIVKVIDIDDEKDGNKPIEFNINFNENDVVKQTFSNNNHNIDLYLKMDKVYANKPDFVLESLKFTDKQLRFRYFNEWKERGVFGIPFYTSHWFWTDKGPGDANGHSGWDEESSRGRVWLNKEKILNVGEGQQVVSDSTGSTHYDEYWDDGVWTLDNASGYSFRGMQVLSDINENDKQLYLGYHWDGGDLSNQKWTNYDYSNGSDVLGSFNMKVFGHSNEIYDFSEDEIRDMDVDNVNKALINHKTLYTPHNTDYNEIETIIRNSATSEDHIPLGLETVIEFYEGEQGTILIDKSSGIKGTDLFVKFKASGANANVIGETGIVHYNVPYLEGFNVEPKYDISVNGNEERHSYYYNDLEQAVIETNVPSLITIQSEGIKTALITNFDTGEKITVGSEDSIIIDTEYSDWIKNDKLNLLIELKDQYNGTLETIKYQYFADNSFFNDDGLKNETGKKVKHKIYTNESTFIGDYYKSDSNIDVDLTNNSLFSSKGTEFDFISNMYLDTNELMINKDTIKVFGDGIHTLKLVDKLGFEYEYFVNINREDPEGYKDYFETFTGLEHYISTEYRSDINLSGIEQVEESYAAKDVNRDREIVFDTMTNVKSVDIIGDDLANSLGAIKLGTQVSEIRSKLDEIVGSYYPEGKVEILLENDNNQYLVNGDFLIIKITSIMDSGYYDTRTITFEPIIN